MSLGIGPAFDARRGVAHFTAMPPRGTPPAVPVYRRPTWAPPPPAPHAIIAPAMWRRQHDSAMALVRERERNAALQARLAAQAGTAAAQQQAVVAQAQLVAAQQQLAALQAQASQPGAVVTAPATPAVVVPPSMPASQPDVSPAAPAADMGPTQDAAAAAAPPTEEEHPGHKWGRRIIIGLALGGVAFAGYKFMKHKKGGGSHAPKPHAVHGFGRSRRRRRR